MALYSAFGFNTGCCVLDKLLLMGGLEATVDPERKLGLQDYSNSVPDYLD